MTRARFFGVAALLSLSFAGGILAQSQPQPTQSPAEPVTKEAAVTASEGKAKPKKVWTNDDFDSPRTPEDIQQDREAAAKVQSSEATAKSEVTHPGSANVTAGPTPTLSDSSPLPTTVEEAERKISEAQDDIVHFQSRLEETRDGYAKATNDDQSAKLLFTIGSIRDDLQERQGDLKLLQDRLKALKNAPVEPPVHQD